METAFGTAIVFTLAAYVVFAVFMEITGSWEHLSRDDLDIDERW